MYRIKKVQFKINIKYLIVKNTKEKMNLEILILPECKCIQAKNIKYKE